MVSVVNDLKDLFTPTIIDDFIQSGEIPSDVRSKAMAIVSRIEGKDYQAPDKNVLKQAFNKGLRALSQEYSGRDNVMITMEHCVHKLLTEETKAILFPQGSDIQYQHTVDGDVAEITTETPTGPHFKVMGSSHIPFGQSNTMEQRISAIKEMVASMAVNKDAGKLSCEEFSSKIGRLRCFLMHWFGLGGSQNHIRGDFNVARRYAIGKHLCNPHFGRAGTQMTANRIGDGIQQPEVIFLRCFLGKDMFNALLTCCGTPTSRDKPSPLDDPSQGEVWERARGQEYRRNNAEQIREYHRNNAEQINARRQQRRQSISQQKTQAAAESILKNAKAALQRYVDCKRKNALQCVTNADMKALLSYIVPLRPADEHDKPTKYKNAIQMRNRLGLPPTGGLRCQEDCLSKYFTNE